MIFSSRATSISALFDHWACASALALPRIAAELTMPGIFCIFLETSWTIFFVYWRELPGFVVIPTVKLDSLKDGSHSDDILKYIITVIGIVRSA